MTKYTKHQLTNGKAQKISTNKFTRSFMVKYKFIQYFKIHSIQKR